MGQEIPETPVVLHVGFGDAEPDFEIIAPTAAGEAHLDLNADAGCWFQVAADLGIAPFVISNGGIRLNLAFACCQSSGQERELAYDALLDSRQRHGYCNSAIPSSFRRRVGFDRGCGRRVPAVLDGRTGGCAILPVVWHRAR